MAKKKENPYLKKGSWLATFLTEREVDGKKIAVRAIAGVYKTAQEAYINATNYGDKEFWKEPPEYLVIELLNEGVYPDCVDMQIICPFLEATGFMDVEGITRPSFMLHQGLAKLEVNDGE